MTRSLHSIAIFSILLQLHATTTSSSAYAKPPNIIVILADDLGYGDLSCFNRQSKIKTPNIDALAKSGISFRDAHSASAVCTPTRYGLLTGRYCWRTPLQKHVIGGLSPRLIEPNRETVASLLKNAGYQTACIGKWHLGMDWKLLPWKKISELSIETPDQVNNVDYLQPIKNGPNSVGFDFYFGISASLDMVPYAFIQNDYIQQNPIEQKNFPLTSSREKGTTRLGPGAVEFTARDVLPKIVESSKNFIIGRAHSEKPFFLYLPLPAPHTPIAPSVDWAGKSGLTPYADFVIQTDAAVGTIMKTLADMGKAENTLVLFTSDNGCSPQANFPELAKLGHHPSYHFRGTKADIFEGGHRVPLIASWPAKIKAKADSTNDQLICLNDIMRTCCDLAEVKVPDNAGEDSVSFAETLFEKEPSRPRKSLVHHSINGSFAIREGAWKLCLCPDSGGWSEPKPNAKNNKALPRQQLYHLENDIGEKNNLEAAHPEIVKRLLTELESIVRQHKNAVEITLWK